MIGLTIPEIFLTFLRILCHHPLFWENPYQLISLVYLPLNRTKELFMVSRPAQSSESDIRSEGALGTLCSVPFTAPDNMHALQRPSSIAQPQLILVARPS